MRYLAAITICLSINVLLPAGVVAEVVPQPIGAFIEEVNGLVFEDDAVIDSEALVRHERNVQQVIEQQARLGAYDASLSQKWLDLAHEAVRLKRPEEAAQLYQRGLHNLRLNAGLTTDKQLVALSDWISVLKGLADTENLGEQLQYRYRITGFGVSDWTDETFDYALEYFDNELAQFAATPWLSNDYEIIRFERHLDDVIKRSCEGNSISASRCGPLVKRRLHLLYLIAFNVEPFVDDQQTRNRLPSRLQTDRSLSNEQLVALERNAYQSGVRMLEKAIALTERQVDLELVLADWRWYFGRRSAARDEYRELHSLHPEWFAVARPLPHGLTEPVISRADRDAVPSTYRFTVNKLGRVKNVSRQAESESELDSSRVRKALRDIRFRPALDSKGEVIESQVVGKYRYLR